MQTGPMTTTQNEPFIPEVIVNEALGHLGAYLDLGKTVSKDTELGAVQVGQTINIPRRGAVVAQQKAQGSPVTTQRPAADDIQVTVDQHWYIRLLEEDFTRSVQPGSVLPGYLEDGLKVLAEQIESSLTEHFSEFDNIDFDSAVNTDSAVKALGRVREQQVKLRIPKLQEKYGYCSPEFVRLLGEDNAFIDPKLIPTSRALIEGAVGRAKGYDIFEGQLVPRAGSPGWDQNFFYTKWALVLASRPLLDPGSRFGVESTTLSSDAGLALRYVRGWSDQDVGVYVHLDTVFGSGVNDERQGFVLESK